MNAAADQAARGSASDARASEDWLEALSSGACDEAGFLRGIEPLVHGHADGAWQMLSLLDQYHRRGAIEPEQFRALKARIAREGLNAERRAGASPGPSPHACRTTDHTLDNEPAVSAPPMSEAPVREAFQLHPPRSAAPPKAEYAPGDLLRGRYRLGALLSQDATGTVYEGSDESLVGAASGARRIAIKVYPGARTPQQLARTLANFQLAQSLSHPNIQRVYQLDSDGERLFATMELLRGTTLAELLAVPGMLERPQALAIIRDVGAALAHAHARGFVHGNLTPENVFLTEDGEVRVLQFDTPSAEEASLVELVWPPPGAAASNYASCQVLAGRVPDARDDLYSLACLAYTLLCGQHPLAGRTALEGRARRLSPKRPSGVSGGQWRALRAGLQWERGERPQDVRSWLDRLHLAGAPPRLPPPPTLRAARSSVRGRAIWTAGRGAAVLVVAIAVWAALEHPSVESGIQTLRGELAALLGAGSVMERAWHAARAGDRLEPPTARASTTAAVPPVPRAVDSNDRSARTPAEALPSAATAAGADGSARARIELGGVTLADSSGALVARVHVRRSGNPHGEVSFTWWTESGSAQAERDFVAFGPRLAHIREGEEGVKLLVPLVADTQQHQPKEFVVAIGQPSAGAALGARTRLRVIIPNQ
jgi:hypothetical protein